MFSFASLNYLSILAVACACHALGAAWYSDWGFGKKWSATLGPPGSGAPGGLGHTFLSFAASLLFCFALALVLQGFGAKTLGNGAWVGFLVGAGILLPAAFSESLFSGWNRDRLLIEAGHRIAASVLAGTLLAAMR